MPAAAQTGETATQSAPVASAQFKARVAELIPLLQGAGDYDATFSAAFRASIPKERFVQIAAQLISTGGPALRIESTTAVSPWEATVLIGFRDATARAVIAVDPLPPHAITGFRVSGFAAREATLDAIAAGLRGLPGHSGIALARLDDGPPEFLLAASSDQKFAIGSGFKLIVLAELVRATNAGERKWTDMVTVDGTILLLLGARAQEKRRYGDRPDGEICLNPKCLWT